jgi:alpha-L-rhamnosidase
LFDRASIGSTKLNMRRTGNRMIFPVNLRCEYRENPLGIDVPECRLSWMLDTEDPSKRNQIQIAYQIRVATAKDFLYAGNPDLWDSGRVVSDRTCQIGYEGKPLTSRTECWWSVRVWDGNGKVSAWSEPALWTMGLLSPRDWKARWIGYDVWEKEFDATDRWRFREGEDEWIWSADTENVKGDYYFRYSFSLKNIDNLAKAPFLITADEYFILYINGIEADRSDRRIFSWTRPRLPDVKQYLRPGINVIGIHAQNGYLDKPGLTGKLYLTYDSGAHEIIRTDSRWKVTNNYRDGWNTVGYNDVNWEAARRVSFLGEKPWRIPSYRLKLPPPRFLRKTFTIGKNIIHAFVYASALGLFELRLNGQKVSNDRLTPGWSDYNKRIYYNTYDVTAYLRKGENGIGAILADGWYAGYIGWERRREYYGKYPRILIQLEITYEDGLHEMITTDRSWKAAYGPIREADLLMGEMYDARLDEDVEDWDTGTFSDTGWEKVVVSGGDSSLMHAYPGNPVKYVMEIQPRQMHEPEQGIYIFDLGQNIAGFVRIRINEKRGTRIVIRHGEVLNADGTLYTENLRMARATDTYIAKGSGEEIWELRFTYHGFRYVEVTGLNRRPEMDTVTGCVIHSDMNETGHVHTSNSLINRIYANIKWSQRSNFIDIPTDCPQRDERLGWSDNHNFFPTASYNMDIAAFYTKWLIDLHDAQEADGAYPAIAPKPDFGVGPLYSGAAAWADSGILIPYYMYKRYGDIRVLKNYYGNMVKYIEYLKRNAVQYICPDYGYGDWLSVNADTPKSLIGTAYFARVCEVMKQIAHAVDKPEDRAKYTELHGHIRNAFKKEFVSGDGKITGETQTGYVLALAFGLLDHETEPKAFRHLVSDIESRDYHLSTGFLGIPHLLRVLTKHNRTDLAYRLLTNESYPSWGYMVKNGATTMWERWNSWTPEHGCYDPLMNSFNHFSLGSFGNWLYETAGGIGEVLNDETDFIIRPEPGGGIDKCMSSFRSVKGQVEVEWEIRDTVFYCKILLPPNSRARVLLPFIDCRPETNAREHTDRRLVNTGQTVSVIGSGIHEYRCKITGITSRKYVL